MHASWPIDLGGELNVWYYMIVVPSNLHIAQTACNDTDDVSRPDSLGCLDQYTYKVLRLKQSGPLNCLGITQLDIVSHIYATKISPLFLL